MKRKLFACFLALTMLTVLTACGGKGCQTAPPRRPPIRLKPWCRTISEMTATASYTGSDSGSGRLR